MIFDKLIDFFKGAFGVQQSSRFTVTFNYFNIAVIGFIVAVGAFHADTKNWTEGDGFFPYGASGVLSGAATCFYAFVGFDIIATTGEEAKDPSKSIPIAIVVSLCIIFVCYFGVSSVLTLMIPYSQLNKLAPIPDAFSQRGIWWANYVISVGAICGLSSSLLGNLFPLPRIIYAMADDGLLFNIFTSINKRTEVPMHATIWPGIVTAFFALLFDLEELVEMMSIGTLLAYTLVSLCVLILRYQPDTYYSRETTMQPLMETTPDPDHVEQQWPPSGGGNGDRGGGEGCDLGSTIGGGEEDEYKLRKVVLTSRKDGDKNVRDDQLTDIDLKIDDTTPVDVEKNTTQQRDGKLKEYFNLTEEAEEGGGDKTSSSGGSAANEPTDETGRTVMQACLSLFVWFFAFNSMILFGFDQLYNREVWALTLITIFGVLILITIGVIYRMPQSSTKFGFMVPFVPLLPIVAIYANTFLMLKLSRITWVRFTVWMVLGISIYVFYGSVNSKAYVRSTRRRASTEVSDNE